MAFFSRKLQGEKANGLTKKRDTGQYAWTPREKETYAIVCCLLKFQSWIGSQEVTVQTDHSAIVKWYKEDLCTISGPMGRRGRWHEFLSRFNLFIEYRPGEDNEGADALSRWAYPAGEAQDTNFHGGDADLLGWTEAERAERDRVRSALRDKYPDEFAAVHPDTEHYSDVCHLTDCYRTHMRRVHSLQVQYLESKRSKAYVSQDGRMHETLTGLFQHVVPGVCTGNEQCAHDDLTGPGFSVSERQKGQSKLSRPMRRQLRFLRAQTAVASGGNSLQDLSWHMPGAVNLAVNSAQTIKIPPAVKILNEDWSDHYMVDPFFAPHWPEIKRESFWTIGDTDYVLHEGKIRADGRICVPLHLVGPVIKAVHAYAHPGVNKTKEMFDRKYTTHLKSRDLKAKIAAEVNSCQVCQAVKGRKGLQPEVNHPYPIPEYPFSSICIDFLELPDCFSQGKTYNNVMIVVCRLTGYILAVPCDKSLTATQLAHLFLERVVGFMGLPQQIFSDHDHLVTAKFFQTLCQLCGIDMKQSPIYRPRSNGRAERAVQVIVDSLRKFLEQTSKKRWVELLPLATWTANDVPGPVHGYSAHQLVFGRNPIGFGDCPPVIPEHGSEDAVSFFKRLAQDRLHVRDALPKIHKKLCTQFESEHPLHVYQAGERVWYRRHKKQDNSKLNRVWEGPGEILERRGRSQYRVATSRGEVILDGMQLKPYLPPHDLNGKEPPLHYYTDSEFLVDSEKYIIEDIVGHTKVGRGKNRHIQWEVKYKGFPDTEFQPASAFMRDINETWTKYNAKHKIDLRLADIRFIASGPHTLHDCVHRWQTGMQWVQSQEEHEWVRLLRAAARVRAQLPQFVPVFTANVHQIRQVRSVGQYRQRYDSQP